MRENAAFIVFMYAFPPEDLEQAITSSRSNFTQLIRDSLAEHSRWPEQMGMLIRLIGSLDYALASKAATSDWATAASQRVAERLPEMRTARKLRFVRP
jgi:hypothetical protein